MSLWYWLSHRHSRQYEASDMLIDIERMDREELEAEDASIRAAETPTIPDAIPTGGELARLIEALTNGEADQALV